MYLSIIPRNTSRKLKVSKAPYIRGITLYDITPISIGLKTVNPFSTISRGSRMSCKRMNNISQSVLKHSSIGILFAARRCRIAVIFLRVHTQTIHQIRKRWKRNKDERYVMCTVTYEQKRSKRQASVSTTQCGRKCVAFFWQERLTLSQLIINKTYHGHQEAKDGGGCGRNECTWRYRSHGNYYQQSAERIIRKNKLQR